MKNFGPEAWAGAAEKPSQTVCLAIGCEVKLAEGAYFCPKHWRLLPPATQDDLLEKKTGMEVAKAQVIIAKKEGRALQVSFIESMIREGKVM